MAKKTISSEKNLTKLEVSLIPEKCGVKEDVEVPSGSPHQRAKVRRTVKLPRLKLEDLVAQVTEENAHKEIPTGPAVGNESGRNGIVYVEIHSRVGDVVWINFDPQLVYHVSWIERKRFYRHSTPLECGNSLSSNLR